jgi:hypothetical protein
MPMVREVRLLELAIWRFWPGVSYPVSVLVLHRCTGVYLRAVPEQLKRVRGFAIVVPFVASMPFRLHSPINHVVPVATLSNLTIANMVCCSYGHGRVICHAHDVLSQAVQTVVNVVQTESMILVVVLGDDSLANEFLVTQ